MSKRESRIMSCAPEIKYKGAWQPKMQSNVRWILRYKVRPIWEIDSVHNDEDSLFKALERLLARPYPVAIEEERRTMFDITPNRLKKQEPIE